MEPHKSVDPDRLPPDYLALTSLVVSVLSLYDSSRLLAWGAALLLLSSFLTRRRSEFDRVQAVLSLVVNLVSLSYIYS